MKDEHEGTPVMVFCARCGLWQGEASAGTPEAEREYCDGCLQRLRTVRWRLRRCYCRRFNPFRLWRQYRGRQ